MSPSYKEPSQEKLRTRPKDGLEMPRSIWSTTGIFVALGVLTVLMGLLMYGAIQGMSSGSSSPDRTPEQRATR